MDFVHPQYGPFLLFGLSQLCMAVSRGGIDIPNEGAPFGFLRVLRVP